MELRAYTACAGDYRNAWIGKTTVIRRVAAKPPARAIRGFSTEEIREHGVRQGFRLVGFDQTMHVIARLVSSVEPCMGEAEGHRSLSRCDARSIDLEERVALDLAPRPKRQAGAVGDRFDLDHRVWVIEGDACRRAGRG